MYMYNCNYLYNYTILSVSYRWYGVMGRAWSLKQSKRPTFKQIRDELDAMFVQSPGDENYYYSRN